MGDFRVRTIENTTDRANMFKHVQDDIKALEIMLAENRFVNAYPQIGAEQEICIVDSQYLPATTNLDILAKINDPHYTHELALFNLEANLDPLALKGNCFSKTETDLLHLLNKGQQVAATFDNHLLLAGILPTLKYRHLQFEYMTPIPRYNSLSKVLTEMRGSDFEIYIQGVDDLNLSLGSMLFEACNTSFQMHLQIEADRFVDKYNWAQMIAGPVLAVGANSPLLFGHELWAETRIPVFKQSLDTRSSSNQMRKKTPRVFFGEDWLRGSPVNLLKEEVARFPFILTSDNFELSTENLKDGKMPDLRALRIHNGTTYTWNRICYGNPNNEAHLRIECRYLPAGPSPIDEMANFAFWVGLMQGQPDHLTTFWKTLDFRTAKNNFLKAARYGSQTVFEWFGKQLTAKQLILEELLPIARKGLEKYKVNPKDIDKYLSVTEHRIQKETNGADWQIRNFRFLQKKLTSAFSLKEMTAQMVAFQKANIPVHEWPDLKTKHQMVQQNISKATVEETMSTDILTVSAEDSVGLASSLVTWHGISHIPVENEKGEIVGMLTDGLLERFAEKKAKELVLVKDIMIKEVISTTPDQTLIAAKEQMELHQLNSLPIVYQRKLMGMIRAILPEVY